MQISLNQANDEEGIAKLEAAGRRSTTICGARLDQHSHVMRQMLRIEQIYRIKLLNRTIREIDSY